MSKYCIKCKWTGIKSPANIHLAESDIRLHHILSWLEMGRSVADSLPYDIEVFKLVDEEEVTKIRNGFEIEHAK